MFLLYLTNARQIDDGYRFKKKYCSNLDEKPSLTLEYVTTEKTQVNLPYIKPRIILVLILET